MPCGWPLRRTCALAPKPQHAWSASSVPRGRRHAYLFANRRANLVKVLVHDGTGVWLAWPDFGIGRLGCNART
jgi:hypothetical protein